MVALFVVLGASACAARRPATPSSNAQLPSTPVDASGFLDDYGLLRPGSPGDIRLVYRNPAADWRRYQAVILDPVSIWRSGRESLAPVPENDLLRLADDFEMAVRSRLGQSFPLVDRPGTGVMRIRLAITEARASDPVLDVETVPAEEKPSAGKGSDLLDTETRRFVDSAVIEGEIVDAETGVVLAQGVDGPLPVDAPVFDTWADVDREFVRWADRTCARLEVRTGAVP